MRVLFLHGWHSRPGGRKPTFLRERGFQLSNPALDPDDFQAALNSAQDAFDEFHPDVVVGSSRGGAVAMNISVAGTPLVLMCPAWKNWGPADKVDDQTILIHSSTDQVVPYSHSLDLVKRSGLNPDRLWDVGEGHRLADFQALSALERAIRSFAKGE